MPSPLLRTPVGSPRSLRGQASSYRQPLDATWLSVQSDAMLRVDPLPEQGPLPAATAARAVARCAARTVVLLTQGRICQPSANLGMQLSFADGTVARVYRETVVKRPPPAEPAMLVVRFNLRRVRSAAAHRLFRLESELNTPLFVGFPGLVSKLWCAHDMRGAYRGLYEWDGKQLAENYARALWRVLALVSEAGSIHFRVLPGLRRHELLSDPTWSQTTHGWTDDGWWRVTAVAASA